MIIADEDSIEKVTLAKVAKRLNVTPMALYTHVADKRDLELIIATSIIKRVFKPILLNDDTSWQNIIKQTAHNLRRTLISYPTILKVFTDQRYFLSPENLMLMEQLQIGISRAGIPLEEGRKVARILGTFVIGMVHFSINTGPEGFERIERLLAKIATPTVADDAAYPYLYAAVTSAPDTSVTTFESCLDYLINMLELMGLRKTPP